MKITVEKSKLEVLLKVWAENRRLWAPVQDKAGTELREVTDFSKVSIPGGNTTLSTKGVLFPQWEELCRYESDGSVSASEPPEKETVVFGVRPCDARAYTLLEKVFTWGREDPYFMSRRRKTFVVSLACASPAPTCFCTSVGGGPGDPAGSDVLAFNIGDNFLLRSVTPRGEELLNEVEGVGRKSSKDETAEAEKQAEQAAGKIGAVEIPRDNEKLRELFNDDIWREVAEGCLGCGACTYSCPTCHCFDIRDETRKGVGRRVRAWDTCQLALFTSHGSGHNPRPDKYPRVRQRILHKFQYCPENFDEIFCVGCGRCITNCPAAIDIRKVLEKLALLVAAE